MAIPALKAERRTLSGTKNNRSLRAQGKVPAVLYGKGKENVNIALDTGAVNKLMHDAEHVVELELDGTKSHALLRAAQRDYLGDNIEHLDLTRVDLNDEVRVNLPLRWVGTPKGSNQGGVLEVIRAGIALSCKASNIPKYIETDVSAVELNQSIFYKDIKLPAGSKLIPRADLLVAICRVPRVIEVAAPAAGEAAAAGAAPAAGAAGAAPAAGAKPAAGAAPAAGAKPAAGAAPAAAKPAAKK